MKNANSNMADHFRLPAISTPETLELIQMQRHGTVLNFSDRILVAGYFFNPNGRCYYGATYRFITADHTCEGQVELVNISGETFEDNGHAIAWAMAN